MKLIKSFLKGFTSAPNLMFKNNKIARADREILEKDRIRIQKDKNNIK